MSDEHGAARWNDPSTAKEAAQALDPQPLYDKIRDALARVRTGLITHEISLHIDTPLWSVSPRMEPMRKKDWVYNTGIQRRWPPSGRWSIVWQLTGLPAVLLPGDRLKPCKKPKSRSNAPSPKPPSAASSESAPPIPPSPSATATAPSSAPQATPTSTASGGKSPSRSNSNSRAVSRPASRLLASWNGRMPEP